MTLTMKYRPIPASIGAFAAARKAREWRAAKARERASVTAWEAEGGTVSTETAPPSFPPKA
jgi:hypothetical protein